MRFGLLDSTRQRHIQLQLQQGNAKRILSGIISSLIVFYFLNRVLPNSKIPAVILTLMLMSSFNFAGIVKNLIQPTMQPERSQIVNALVTLARYQDVSRMLLDKREYPLDNITSIHKSLVKSAGREDRFAEVRKKYKENQKVIDQMREFLIKELNINRAELQFAAPESNYKVVELLEHLVRDWSSSSKRSRDQLFNPVLNALKKYSTGDNVFLPGAGLSRLAYECCKLGYNATAMDMSAVMYLGSRYMINSSTSNSFTVYPYVNEFSHVVSAAHQLEGEQIHPPGEIIKKQKKPHLLIGDFTTHRETYDSVITLFFLDTAQNILQYMDNLSKLTKKGGIWINYGPMKYGTGACMELTMEELKFCINNSPEWEIIEEWTGTNTYQGHPESLWQAHYRIHGWVARRRRET